jgi:uncharacterized secreted repeat protein (TIGR03808 family)
MRQTASNPTRRHVLAGLAAATAAWPLAATAKAPAPAKPSPHAAALLGSDVGLVPNASADQSVLLQQAVDLATARGVPLFLAGGSYRVGNVSLAANTTIEGVGGATRLLGTDDAPILRAAAAAGITLRALSLDGSTGGGAADRSGLIALTQCDGLRLDGLDLQHGSGTGLFLDGCSGLVTGSSFASHGNIGVFAINSQNLTIAQNRVAGCGNGGILVWRDSRGHDGTIVSGNHVSAILARGGGNGQNGNGINIFRADGVIVADNIISDCDFSAVRANTARNTQIRGNTCTNLREVAIFSEFAFSGSLIAGNIVDGAAAGISMTNLDQGGRLAVCSGNIVRNITPNSSTNPDTTPYGISAEADAAVTGNTVSNVPGIGISAGYGPYLANVLIANNVVTDVNTGIAVSVAPGAGAVRIAGNLIAGAKTNAIAGMRWQDVASADLAADAGNFPNVSIDGNTVSP